MILCLVNESWTVLTYVREEYCCQFLCKTSRENTKQQISPIKWRKRHINTIMTRHCKTVFVYRNGHCFIKRTTRRLEFFIRDTLIFHYLTCSSNTAYQILLLWPDLLFHREETSHISLQRLLISTKLVVWMVPELIGGGGSYTHRCLKLIYCLPREGAWWELLVPAAFKVTKLFRKLILLPERFFVHLLNYITFPLHEAVYSHTTYNYTGTFYTIPLTALSNIWRVNMAMAFYPVLSLCCQATRCTPS